MHKFPFFLLVYFASFSLSYAALPNPLMAPKPSSPAQIAQGTGPVPDGMRLGGANSMPAGSPMSMPAGYQQGGAAGQAKVEVIDLNAVPEELYSIEDKWFVSAVMENAAILRPREGAASGSTPAAGMNPMQPMGYPGMQGGAGPASAAATPSGPSSVMKSIMLVHGVTLILRGKSLSVAIKDGVVSLSYLAMSGKSMLVYRSGVDVYSVKREVQTTKEVPSSSFVSSILPSINGVTGSAGSTGTGTNGGAGTLNSGAQPQ